MKFHSDPSPTRPWPAAGTDVRRRSGERRERRIPALRYWLYGRRRRYRRHEDQGYVDIYDPLLVSVSIATLLLSCADAYYTLLLITSGARELNPVMDLLLGQDVRLFVSVKIALTGVGLLVLMLHNNFRVIGGLRVLHLKYALFFFYLLLVVYEFHLLTYY
ncbi:MAG: DUF5658 family protein [Gammaproteobacteria bacterium]